MEISAMKLTFLSSFSKDICDVVSKNDRKQLDTYESEDVNRTDEDYKVACFQKC